MSRARRYPVAGDPADRPVPADKPVPTKEQFLTILDSARGGVMTRSELLVAGARLYGMEPGERLRRYEAVSWARTVIDYPAAERRLEAMKRDELIVGRAYWEWAEMGHRFGGAQTHTTYYMTARRYHALVARNERHTDDALMRQAEEAADQWLRKLHRSQWERARDEAYDALRRGLLPPQPDSEES